MRRARISLDALARNAARLLAVSPASATVDLRADAYGHGAREVATTLAAEGLRSVLVSTDVEGDTLRTLLGSGVEVVVGDPQGTLVGPELYGFDAGYERVMTVSADTVGVRRVAAGEGISYGHTYRLERESTLALVPLGYSDGLHRFASNRARVTLGGALRPIAGRVAMDVHVLDLGDDDVSIGDEAVLFGRGGATVDDFARAIDTSPAEITTGLGARLPRRYE